MLGEFKGGKNRNGFSKYYGMKEITGGIWYCILWWGESMPMTPFRNQKDFFLKIGILIQQDKVIGNTKPRLKWFSLEVIVSISQFVVFWDYNFSWQGNFSDSVCLTLGVKDTAYLPFVAEDLGVQFPWNSYSSQPNLSLHFWKIPKSTQTPNAFILERFCNGLHTRSGRGRGLLSSCF